MSDLGGQRQADIRAPGGAAVRPSMLARLAARIGIRPRTLVIGIAVPLVALAVVAVTVFAAPPEETSVIVFSTLVAVAAGLSSTAIGVYGGVLVPGLLLLGVDARFAAAVSLFLQVLVIPLPAGSHYRLRNASRSVALPLLVGGMIGAFVGPFFAAALPKAVIARFVAGMIVFVGAIVLGTM